MRRALVVTVPALLFGAGCLVGPNYERPLVVTPPNYRDQAPTRDPASIADLPWWQVFQDPELVAFIGRGAPEQPRPPRDDGAWWSRPGRWPGCRRRRFYPALGAGAVGCVRAGLHPGRPTEAPNSGATFVLDATFSWELDVWGRIRRGTEAAVAQYLATEEGYRAATVSLVADVALAYVQLRQLDAQLDVAQRTVVNYQRTLQLYDGPAHGRSREQAPGRPPGRRR